MQCHFEHNRRRPKTKFLLTVIDLNNNTFEIKQPKLKSSIGSIHKDKTKIRKKVFFIKNLYSIQFSSNCFETLSVLS